MKKILFTTILVTALAVIMNSVPVQAFDCEIDNPDGEPPNGVSGATVIITALSDSQISVSWLAVGPDNGPILGYQIYRNGLNPLVFVTTSQSLPVGTRVTYTDIGLTANTQYSYRIQSVDTCGNAGVASSAKFATTTPSSKFAIRRGSFIINGGLFSVK